VGSSLLQQLLRASWAVPLRWSGRRVRLVLMLRTGRPEPNMHDAYAKRLFRVGQNQLIRETACLRIKKARRRRITRRVPAGTPSPSDPCPRSTR
jgi:hypothetical protein